MTPTAKALPSEIDLLRWVVKKWYRSIGIGVGFIYVLVGLYTRGRGGTPVSSIPLERLFPDLTYKSLPSLYEFVALAPLPFACAMVKLPQWLLERREGEGNEAAIKSCEQFRWALAGLVSMWCVFYFLVFFNQWRELSPASQAWIDFFNNLQGVFLFACYWILTTKTTQAKDDGKEGRPPLWAVYLFLLWAVLLFLGADVYFSTTAGSTREQFQLFSGLWVGASLALLVGCLEGQYLGQPRRVAFLLYFYAALQVAYVGFFSRSSSLELFATITSLPLKLIFIGFWMWVLENGLLAFYMRKTRKDIEHVRGEWGNFSSPAES